MMRATTELVAPGMWASYITVGAGTIKRTAEVIPATLMVDLDDDDRILGVEVIGDQLNVGHLVEVLRQVVWGAGAR